MCYIGKYRNIPGVRGRSGGVDLNAFTNIFDNMKKISYKLDGILYSVFFDGTCNEAVNEQ